MDLSWISTVTQLIGELVAALLLLLMAARPVLAVLTKLAKLTKTNVDDKIAAWIAGANDRLYDIISFLSSTRNSDFVKRFNEKGKGK